jgi:hypothetical protein
MKAASRRQQVHDRIFGLQYNSPRRTKSTPVGGPGCFLEPGPVQENAPLT